MSDLEAKAKELDYARNIYWDNYRRKLCSFGLDHPRTQLARRLYGGILTRYYATLAEARGEQR